MDDPIKKILTDAINTKRPKKPKKTHGSFSIDDEKWSTFKKLCLKHNIQYSDVIEQLISAYLQAAEERGELDDLDQAS